MRSLGKYLVSHHTIAALLALMCTTLPFIGLPTAWISAVIAGLITLRCGVKAGLYIIAWAALPAIAMSIDGYWQFLFSTLVLGNLIVWGLAILLRTYRSWILLIQTITLAGLVIMIAINLLFPHIHTWYAANLIVYFKQINSSMSLDIATSNLETIAKITSRIAIGLQMLLLFAGTMLYLLIARWWQATLFNPKGLSQEWLQIKLNKFFSLLLPATVILIVTTNSFISWDALPIICLPFLLAGLSLTQALLRQKKYGTFYLVGIYTMLIFLFPYTAALLMLAAFIDSWYDFRK